MAFTDITVMAGNIDTSNLDAALASLGTGGGGLSPGARAGMQEITVGATVDANTSAAETALANVRAAADAFASATFTSTFDLDIGPFSTAYTNAYTGAEAWESAIFTATLSADNSNALRAIADATMAAQGFAGTYTATLSVNTSGALASARAAAQDIADLLPNSPAKKGPLSKVPNFDYIVDAAQSSFNKLGSMSEQSLSAFGGSFGAGARGAASGGGMSVPVTLNFNSPIYGIDDFEDSVVRTFETKLGPAITLSLQRRDRQLGAS
jgi:hypothetical protein